MPTPPDGTSPAKKVGPTSETGGCAAKILQWYEDGQGKLGVWKTTWQQIGNYVVPRKSQILVKRIEGSNQGMEEIYSLTAADAVQVHAGGEMDYLFSGKWFKFAPPGPKPAPDAVAWYEVSTEIALQELLRSNFMLETHEMLLDRVGFGTSPLHCEEGRQTTLNFTNHRIGTYTIAENSEHIVDTIICEVEMTARQAVQEFGLDGNSDEDRLRGNRGVSKKIRDAYLEDDPKKKDERFMFLHAVYPRDDRERDVNAMDGANKPIASCWVDKANRKLCRESGYDEMPTAVTRYLKWEKDPYGYSPSMLALPGIKSQNLIERTLLLLIETKAVPRILVPDNLDGNDIDFRAGGQTTYDASRPEALPKEWLTQADAKLVVEYLQSKDEIIRNLYLYDLWKMLAEIEREMTAYEVKMRLAEKLAGITPAFHRMQVEFFNVILRRVFAICLRKGKFSPPPASVMKPDDRDPQNAAKMTVHVPDVVLTGKLAMYIRESDNNSFMQWVQSMIPIAEVIGVSALNVVDTDAAFRGMGINSGVPVAWMRTPADVRKLKAAQDAAAQQQQQMEMAKQTAPALAAASKASPQMQSMLTGAAQPK